MVDGTGVVTVVEGIWPGPVGTAVPGFVFCTVVQPPSNRAIMRIKGRIIFEFMDIHIYCFHNTLSELPG
jgi:hypothetical protein